VLNEGGTISWTGDPYSGTLGMCAKYQLKTSLNSLGLDQDSSYRNRIPVDCIIGLTGPIMNPNVKFRFEFPNATEEVKQYVFTKIDTTNPSEMSQQMLSLLVLNSFSFNNSNSNGNIAKGMIAYKNQYSEKQIDTFNLGYGEAHSLIELVQTLEKHLNIKAKLEFTDTIREEADTTWANTQKAANILAFNAHIDFDSGIKNFCNWFLKQ